MHEKNINVVFFHFISKRKKGIPEECNTICDIKTETEILWKKYEIDEYTKYIKIQIEILKVKIKNKLYYKR